MDDSRVDVLQLKRRDPLAWTAMLAGQPGLHDLVATAVTVQPLASLRRKRQSAQNVHRYLVSLANHSDPISFIAKEVSQKEALFYRELADPLAFLAPRCWYVHMIEDGGWLILDDVPDHVKVYRWAAEDVETVIGDLAELHARFWNNMDLLADYPWLNHWHSHDEPLAGRRESKSTSLVYSSDNPGSVISEHAVRSAGRLTPIILEAAKGLVVMRDLGGWPGVLGEVHLTAAADLLDDPLPMLEPLLRQPHTLVHGDPHVYNWRLTLFEQRRLLDWSQLHIGSGLWDIVSFQEQFDLHYAPNGAAIIQARESSPASEETMIDTYLLAMGAKLGSRFDARSARQALPAARCLFVLLKWFPEFARWHSRLPDKNTWQQISVLSEEELYARSMEPLAAIRPYLRDVFDRFLRAYRML